MILFYGYSSENMQKKSFTYKEAIKAILYFLGVIIMIESNYVLVPQFKLQYPSTKMKITYILLIQKHQELIL